jgi:hypothetical protein
VPIGVESTAESLRSKPEKKEKTAHPTTDNANVTDVEEEEANFHRMGLFLLDNRG